MKQKYRRRKSSFNLYLGSTTEATAKEFINAVNNNIRSQIGASTGVGALPRVAIARRDSSKPKPLDSPRPPVPPRKKRIQRILSQEVLNRMELRKPGIGLESEMQFFRMKTSTTSDFKHLYSKTFAESIGELPNSTTGITKIKDQSVIQATFDNCKEKSKTCGAEIITSPVSIDLLPKAFAAIDCWLASSFIYESETHSDFSVFLNTYNNCITAAASTYGLTADHWKMKKVDVPVADCSTCNENFSLEAGTGSSGLSAARISTQLNIGIPIKNFRKGKGLLKLISKNPPPHNEAAKYNIWQIYQTWKIAQDSAQHFMRKVETRLPAGLSQNRKESLEGLITYLLGMVGKFFPTKNSWKILPKTKAESIYRDLFNNTTEKTAINKLLDEELFNAYNTTLEAIPKKEKDDVYEYIRKLNSTQQKDILTQFKDHKLGDREFILHPSMRNEAKQDGILDFLSIMNLQAYLMSQSYTQKAKRLPIDGRWISQRGQITYNTGEQLAYFLLSKNALTSGNQQSKAFIFGTSDSFTQRARNELFKFLKKMQLKLQNRNHKVI